MKSDPSAAAFRGGTPKWALGESVESGSTAIAGADPRFHQTSANTNNLDATGAISATFTIAEHVNNTATTERSFFGNGLDARNVANNRLDIDRHRVAETRRAGEANRSSGRITGERRRETSGRIARGCRCIDGNGFNRDGRHVGSVQTADDTYQQHGEQGGNEGFVHCFCS